MKNIRIRVVIDCENCDGTRSLTSLRYDHLQYSCPGCKGKGRKKMMIALKELKVLLEEKGEQ